MFAGPLVKICKNKDNKIQVDSSFCAENLHLTVLWFRNSTFLDPSNQPLIHPVAALISSELQPDDQQYLLNQFAAKLAEIDDNKGICRLVWW